MTLISTERSMCRSGGVWVGPSLCREILRSARDARLCQLFPRRVGIVTREQVKAYMRANIDRLCAEQGVSVEIKDPALIAVSIQLLTLGRRNCEGGATR